MESMYGEHGIGIGNLTAMNDAILEANGAEQDTITVSEIISCAIDSEAHLHKCGIYREMAEGAVAEIKTIGEPVGGKTVIGNKLVLRRAAHEWRLMKLGHVICYPGDQGSFNVILTDRQQAVIREAQEYAAAA